MPRTCVMGCAITDDNRLHAFPKSQDRYNIWVERLCGGYPPSRSDLHACRRHFHKRFHYQWALAKTALPEYFLHPNSNYVAPDEPSSSDENKEKYISSTPEPQPLRKHSKRVPIISLTQSKSIQTDNVEPLQLQHNTETATLMNMRPQQHLKIVQPTVQVVPLEQSTKSSMPRKVTAPSDNGITVNNKISILRNVPVIPVTAATPSAQPFPELTTTTVHTMCETRDIDEQQLVEIILPEIHVKDLKEGILLYQSDNMVTLEFLKPEYNSTLPGSTNNLQKENKEKESNEVNNSLKFMELAKKIALEDKTKDASIVKKNQSTCKVSQIQTKKDDTFINIEKLIKIQDPVKIKGAIKILKISKLNVNKPVSIVKKLSLNDDGNQLQNGTEQECNKDKNIIEEKEKCSETKNYKKANAGSVHKVTDSNQNQVNLYARGKCKEKYVNLDKQKLIESHEEQLDEDQDNQRHDLNEDDEKVGFPEEKQDESQVATLEQEEDDVSGKRNTSNLSEAKGNDKNQNNEKETNKDNPSTEVSHNESTVDVHINITHDLILNNQIKEVELTHNLGIEEFQSSMKTEFQLASKEKQASEIIMEDQYKEKESELTNNRSTKKTQSEMKHKVQLSVNESDEKENGLKNCDDNSEKIVHDKDEDSNGNQKKRQSNENKRESQYKKAKFDQFSENEHSDNGRIEKVNNSLLNDDQDGRKSRYSIIEEDIAKDEMNEHKKGESWSPLILFEQTEIDSYSETISTQEDFLDEYNEEGKNQEPLDSSQKDNLEKLGCKENCQQNICEEHSELQIHEIKDKEQKESEVEKERSKTKKVQRVNRETRHTGSKVDGTNDGNNSTSASQHEDDKRKQNEIVENEPDSDWSIISDHNCDTADVTATKSNDQHRKEEWGSTSKHKMMSVVVDKENKTPDASKWKIKIIPKGSLKPRILKVSRSKALGNSFMPIKGQLHQSTVPQQHPKRLSRTNRSYLSTKKLQFLKANLRDPLFVINTNSTGINNTKISTILTTATKVAAPKHAPPIPLPPSLSSSTATMVTTPVMSQAEILQVTPVCLHDKVLLQQDSKRFQQKTNKEPNDSITKSRNELLLNATDQQNLKHKQQSLLKKNWYSDIVNKVKEAPLQPCVKVQTDFRFQGICALVDTNRFHLNCFYCSEFYPLSLWPEFVQHIKTKHEIEKKSDNFISDHDYTLMTSPSKKKPSERRLIIEKEIIINDNVEHNASEGDDSKSSCCALSKSRRNNLRELSTILQKKYCKTRKHSFKSGLFGKAHNQLKRFDNNKVAGNTIIPIDDNNIIQDMTADIMTMPVQWEVIQQTPPIQKARPKQVGTPLKIEQVDPINYVATPQGVNSRLQRPEIIAQHSLTTSTNQQPINPSLDILQNYDNEDDLLKSKDGIGIVFGQTDHEVVIDFLLNLKNFPLLYKHQKECYQKDYDEAILRMCCLLNDKYQLDITDLELRRSIHRVTDWYCFTLDDLERHNKAARAKRWRTAPLPPYPHAFPEYFEICARFLPNTRVCDNLLMKNIAQVVCKRYNQPVIYPSWVKFLPMPQQADNKRSQAMPTPVHKVNIWESLPKRKLSFEEPLEENNEVKEENGTVLIKEQIELKKRELRKKPEGNVGKTRRRGKPRKILNNRVFKCETCGREFRDRCMFRIHKLRHLPPRFKCDKCTKEFYRNHQLQHHMRSRHATVPPFICEFCGKTISSQNSLKIHIDNKHHNVRFHCVVCQYTTYTSSKLTKHQKKWHVAVEGTVEQLSRRKIAYDKFNMTGNCTELDHKATKLWMSSVKIPGIKNYTCTLCHLVFDNLKDIKRHNRQLHPIRCITYMCVLCRPNKMITRNNLRRHYERIHHAHGDGITELMKRSKPVLALATGKDHPTEHDNNVKTNVDDLYCDLMEQNENNFDQEACDIIDIKKQEITEAVASLKHVMGLRSSLDEVKIDDEYLETIFEGTT